MFRPFQSSSEVHVIFDGLALHHSEQHDPFSVPKTGQSAFKAKLAPDLVGNRRSVPSPRYNIR